MAKQLFSNGASATLAVTLIDTDTTVQVQAGYGALFPSPTGGDWFTLTLEDNNAHVEVVRCTARSGDLLTVVRAQEGTPAQGFSNTVTRCELRDTKGTYERFLQRSGDALGGNLDLGGFALSNGTLATSVGIPNTSVFPVGMITLWSGSIGSIPAGWALCDGTSGTPDLRDRFVVGAGDTYAVGASGGANSVTPTASNAGAHDHGAATGGTTLTTAQIPSHGHTVIASQYSGDDSDPLGDAGSGFLGSANTALVQLSANGSGTPLMTGGGSGGPHNHSIPAAVDHTHTISAVDTRSPYYALAYIMFVGA